MELSLSQRDSLVELINIAFGRAAAALSELTGHRIELNVPQVVLVHLDDLQNVLDRCIQGEIATVHQIFAGPIAGNALLVLDHDGAVALVSLLNENRLPFSQLDASDREVLTEVGNILLNACLGTFGNILEVRISFSVPQLQLSALSVFLRSLTIQDEELKYSLMVVTNFHIKESNIGGYLIIILGVSSLTLLLEAVDKLA